MQLIPTRVLEAISRTALPCFVYDAAAVQQRALAVASLLDTYFFPVKACTEPGVVRAVVAAGCGLDLCSNGDVGIAVEAGCPGERWKLTAVHCDDSLLGRVREAGGILDADSVEQAVSWAACGGTVCGLRIMVQAPGPLYHAKFGLAIKDLAAAAQRLAAAGVRVEGLHLHDQHANLMPDEFANRVIGNLAAVDRSLLRGCRYLNIGGSWPMRHGNPAPVEELRGMLARIREQMAGLDFKGVLYGEPGRWVTGPCGYWAARVAAVKGHPLGAEHRVVVLDTSTPVPSRPSLAPFVVLRAGSLLQEPRAITCDIFGSANTALDQIGREVRLPLVARGDVVVSLGQGAYTRSLIGPFNERERPAAMVLEAATTSSDA